MMSNHHSPLRALVEPASEQRSSTRARRTVPLRAKALLTALVVAACSIGAIALLLTGRHDGPADTSVDTVALDGVEGSEASHYETSRGFGQSAAAAPAAGGQFDDLRHLPTGPSIGVELQSILRIPRATPIAAFSRTDSTGLVSGLVFIDRGFTPIATGPGVEGVSQIQIGGIDALVAPAGPVLSYLVQLDVPTVGELTASGFGLTKDELVTVTGDVVGRVADPGAHLPEQWTQLYSSADDASRSVWRTYFLGEAGDVAVFSASVAASAPSVCSASDRAHCDQLHVEIDDDGVELMMIGTAGTNQALAEALRPVSDNNARVRQLELEPLESVPLMEAPDLLYLPPADSDWTVAATHAHRSASGVSQPGLVLVERLVPTLGRVTSAVVVHPMPLGTAGDIQHGESSTIAFEETQGATLRLSSSNHSVRELDTLGALMSVGDQGLQFALRSVGDVGLERDYERAFYAPFPTTEMEGIVFGAEVVGPNGDQVSIRVSSVSGFVPESAAAAEHDNLIVTTPIRGTTASLIVNDGVARLSWQERPGVLVTLTGSESDVLMRLARSLEVAPVPPSS